MKNSLKKRGQKLVRKFSRASVKVSEESKEHIKENFLGRLSHIKNVRLLILEWALLVAVLFTLAIAQAVWSSSTYAKTTFVRGGTYTEATLGRINSLNPLFATTSSEKTLSRLMFATLVAEDASGHPGPALAKTIRPSEGGRVWTLKLRDNLYWSDGEPLTNADVLFTISLIQNPAVASIYSANLSGVKVTENESGEIIFTLTSEYADFLSALIIPVVPKHVLENAPVKTLVEDNFSLSPVTSGAFAFNAIQGTTLEDERIVYLVSNPYYYRGEPLLKSFAVHAYTSKDNLTRAVNGGSVSATAELSGADADKVTAGSFMRRETPINSGVFLFFNTSRSWVNRTDFRTAVRQGLNLETIRAAAPGTNALNYPIINSQIALSTPTIPSYDFASAYGQVNAITEGQKVSLSIATVNSGYLPAVAEAVAEELRALGLEVEVAVSEENQDFVTNVIAKRNYDILIYEIELGADPDPLPYYHSSQISTAGLNLSNYRNALVDDLLVGARETLDTTLRAKKYETFLSYWVADVPAIGLYQANLTYLYNKNVRPYSETAHIVAPLDRFQDVEIWSANKEIRDKTP